MIQLKVPPDEAESFLLGVINDKFSEAIPEHWRVDEQGYVKAQSILWLFCWAVTGMGSLDSAEEAREVFEKVLPFTYGFFRARVPHEWARQYRYAKHDIEADLGRLLKSS
jgi:hypothetical protein